MAALLHAGMNTASEVALTATAVNIAQVDWANTNTKMSIAEGHCSCWNKANVQFGEYI